MQRVRIGLTGLAAVFFIVMIAGALVRGASNEAPVTAPAGVSAAPATDSVKSGEAKPVSEPLVELGVAPSPAAGPANESADKGN